MGLKNLVVLSVMVVSALQSAPMLGQELRQEPGQKSGQKSEQNRQKSEKDGRGEAPDGAAPSKTKDGPRGGKGRRDSGPAAVRVMTANPQLVPLDLTFVAILTGKAQADIFPKVSGRVTSFGAAEGQAVKAGQVLLKIDRNDPGESYLSTPVVTPIAGWVGQWHVQNVGEQVSPQSPVVTIVDDSALRAVLHLPVETWLRVSRETRVSVGVGDERREASVISVSRSADLATARGSVTVEIRNPGHEWRAGMVARVTLSTDPRRRITIPTTALIITDAGTFIYIADSGKARRVPVNYRLLNSDLAEVTEGLAEGSTVIHMGTNQISDGADVQVVDH